MIEPSSGYNIEDNETIQPNLLEFLNNLTNVQAVIERVLPLIPNQLDDSELKLHLPRTVTNDHPNGPNITHQAADFISSYISQKNEEKESHRNMLVGLKQRQESMKQFSIIHRRINTNKNRRTTTTIISRRNN
ncbi:unnamed protein product, partial [Didymodactylos carnosus]